MTTSAAAVRRSGKKCVRSLCLRYSFAGLSSGEGGALQVLCCMLHATFLCASTSLAVIFRKLQAVSGAGLILPGLLCSDGIATTARRRRSRGWCGRQRCTSSLWRLWRSSA